MVMMMGLMVTPVMKGLRILCWQCLEDVQPDERKYLNRMVKWEDLHDYPLEKGLELRKCKDKNDLGEKVECPHKHARCFKAELDCYKDKDTKERGYFRGCGGYATIGRDIVDQSMRHIIWDTDNFTEHHRKGDHVVIDLPDSHFPSIKTYLFENKCLRRNHSEELAGTKMFQDVSGKLDMCDRVYCNHADGRSLPTIWISLLIVTIFILAIDK